MVNTITWTNEKRKLSDLIPWADNPREITKEQGKRLTTSLRKFGYSQPIEIEPDNLILDGHQRDFLMQTMSEYTKDTLLDVRVASRKFTDAERREYVLYKGQGASGEWNMDLISSWDPKELIEWGGFTDAQMGGFKIEPEGEDPGAQVDKAAELREKWQAATGQLWKLGEHRLICGDCTDRAVVERVMGGKKADCVFTSPPYAVGVDYGDTYADTIDNLRGMLPILSRLWFEFVTAGGFAVVNFGDIAPASDIAKVDEPCEYPMAIEYWPIFRNDGWVLWSRRVWCKSNARVNSLWCIGSNRAATDWEHIWTWKKPGKAIIARVDGDYRSALGWFETDTDHQGVEKKEVHGAGMPILTAEKMIAIHSLRNGIVIEPFVGTGTTLIACERLGRKCMAIEISPAYVAVAIDRWATMTGGVPELIEQPVEQVIPG